MARQADPDHPGLLAAWTETAVSVGLAPFAGCFTRPTRANLLVLVAGAILSPGRRTVAAALSSVGLRGAAGFTNYHRVLNRSRWSGRTAARCLLGLLVVAFVPDGPVVVGIDETIERRWGAKIKARGIYRDPVRSSHGHFVKASGLRWISLMLLAPVPFAGKVWALPFLTALAPSERYAQAQGRSHKPLTERARLLLRAGHDAIHMAPFCRSQMIFVPCEDGISHSERETMTRSDAAAGAAVLLRVLCRMAS